MDTNSDSSHTNSSGSDSDHPYTPPSAAPHIRASTGGPFTAPSKIPKLKPTSTQPLSLSQPPTPTDSSAASSTLDWGGGDWSRLVNDIKRKSAEMPDSPTKDGALSREQSISEESGEQAATTDRTALRSPISFSVSSDDGDRDTHDAKHIDGIGQTKEVSAEDDKSVAPLASRDSDLPTCEPEELHAITAMETEASDTDASHESDFDSNPNSDSDQSVVHLPTVRIRGPFLNTATKERAAEHGRGPTPQTILRGLIRDAHREMMYFTLSHSQFSLDDLRQGLDYAYGMLQTVISKLTILAVLHDDMTDMNATDLRRWISHVDDLDPKTRYEPRMLVIFESLSAGEIRIALAELVQSRLIVEDEVKQTRALLMDRATAQEEEAKETTPLIDSAVKRDRGAEGSGAMSQFDDGEDIVFGAILTAMMVSLIGVLYFCVRE